MTGQKSLDLLLPLKTILELGKRAIRYGWLVTLPGILTGDCGKKTLGASLLHVQNPCDLSIREHNLQCISVLVHSHTSDLYIYIYVL